MGASIAGRVSRPSSRDCRLAVRSGDARVAEIFGDQTTLELDARHQHIAVTPFNGVDRRSVFDVNPERIVVCTNDGIAAEQREEPRASFAGYEVTTPWDALQVGYFISYACWNYLTAPFLFT